MDYFEELYDNGFLPSEEGKPQGIAYANALKRANDTAQKILVRMDEDGKQLFQDYINASADITSAEIAKAFSQGAKFVGEIFVEICRK